MANRISFLIWAVALLVHTCLLALIISFDDLELVGPVVVFGFILTFFITLPALFLVRIIIAVCDKLDLNGQQALLRRAREAQCQKYSGVVSWFQICACGPGPPIIYQYCSDGS